MEADGTAGKSLAAVPAVMFLTSMATLVQSFVVVKLALLTLFLLACLLESALGRRTFVFPKLLIFYLWIASTGIGWALLGLVQGNHFGGVLDAIRLYVVWSAAFFLLYTMLRSRHSLKWIHTSLVSSAILISAINLVGLADQLAGWGLVSEGIRRELELRIGLHEGYIQITSRNIGSLFLIVPYLVALQCRRDARASNTMFTKLALALSLIVVAVSGRRALWLVVVLTPATVYFLSVAARSVRFLRDGAKRGLVIYGVLVVLAAMTFVAPPTSIQRIGYLRHLMDAFSAQDERSIQKSYLIAGFEESPFTGSGFGAYAGYLRNDERPWTYELTYHQMLFNLGAVGITLVGGLFIVYGGLVIGLLRRFHDRSDRPFALLVAEVSLLLGTISNPYLNSFDFLFFLGLLPYLSTFERGFEAEMAQPPRLPRWSTDVHLDTQGGGC